VRTAKISYITGCKQRRWKGRCKTEDRIRAGHWITACESWGWALRRTHTRAGRFSRSTHYDKMAIDAMGEKAA